LSIVFGGFVQLVVDKLAFFFYFGIILEINNIMKKYLSWITALFAAVFIIGSGVIVYIGRPAFLLGEMYEGEGDDGGVAETNLPEVSSPVVNTPAANTPVVNKTTTSTNTNTATNTNTSTSTQTSGPNSYTFVEVQAHGTASSCWSAINGSVYDLTTWVSRHPGGAEAIMKLCGVDGSARFNKKHGTFTKALDALILLKIGTLQ